ncbi:MAG: hypothetical protein KZQ80_09065 [Candidatus Thiodiazotropha sp. (ex Monitilora ramsayi)]|nr:hypothetical protein [Candidatus Thiodiazotropha sp. (ex Monitilora ramsayi)]
MRVEVGHGRRQSCERGVEEAEGYAVVKRNSTMEKGDFQEGLVWSMGYGKGVAGPPPAYG